MSKIDGVCAVGKCPLSGSDDFVGLSSYVNKIPDSWVGVSIGNVSSVTGGGTPPSKDESCFAPSGEGIPWITPADLSGYQHITIRNGKRDLTEKGLRSCSAKKMPKGSVLFSSRAPIGYVAIAETELTTNQGFKSFVFHDGIDSRFAYYQLRYLKPVAEAMATGTTFKELSGAAAAKLPFALAPLNEQRRIADKLDRVLARVDAANEHLSRVGFLLKRFRQAVLRAAISGQLTDGWRSESDGGGWSWCRLADVANVGTGSTPLKSNSNYYSFRGVPWITSSATGADFIEGSDSYVTELALKEYGLKIYPPGTLVVAMYGEGKTRGQVSELMLHAAVNQACASVEVVSDLIDAKFLKIFLQANYEKMRLMAEGGNQPNLSLSKIKDLSVPLPSVEVQREIVRRVSSFMTRSRGIERRLAVIRSVSDELTPTLLTKAFCGELVPQKPDDEPASELLARVFEAKTSENHKPTRRKRQASV